MNAVFCIILPSILGIDFYSKLIKEKDKMGLIFKFSELLLFSNLLCMITVKIINNFEWNLIDYIQNNNYFAVKYVILLIILNLFLAFIFSVLKKDFSISLEKENKQKNEKRKSKKSN